MIPASEVIKALLCAAVIFVVGFITAALLSGTVSLLRDTTPPRAGQCSKPVAYDKGPLIHWP